MRFPVVRLRTRIFNLLRYSKCHKKIVITVVEKGYLSIQSDTLLPVQPELMAYPN